jgi:PhnB protein
MPEILFPKLIVANADTALQFYTHVLGAVLKVRHTDDTGRVVHAELELHGHHIAVAEAVTEWGWHSPSTTQESPVLLTVVCDDPDGVAQRMIDRGATVLVPIEDRPYGKREGRLRDPFGHLWIISGDPRPRGQL